MTNPATTIGTTEVLVTERTVSHAAYRAGEPDNLSEAGTEMTALSELGAWLDKMVEKYCRASLNRPNATTFVVNFYTSIRILRYQLEISCDEADAAAVSELLARYATS